MKYIFEVGVTDNTFIIYEYTSKQIIFIGPESDHWECVLFISGPNHVFENNPQKNLGGYLKMKLI